ncbi:hypothetical protein LCGC14_0432590 [marine sediment metagenome]|uniref:Uncharacterized protein n=1 Tax=marine sediment metagenome TaxID=412755 RepID=A0A0F9SMI6_9ZZZZ
MDEKESEEMWRLQNRLSKCELCNKYFARQFVFIHQLGDLTKGKPADIIKTLSTCIKCVPKKD